MHWSEVILHCWRFTCTALDVGTLPPVHAATELKNRQSIRCYIVQFTSFMTRLGRRCGPTSSTIPTEDALGSFLQGIGGGG